jgi:hypothetical protein
MDNVMTPKISFVLLFIFTFFLTGCAAGKKEKIELDTIDKQLSYLFVFDSASQVQELGIKFDADVVRQAVQDANSDAGSRLSAEQYQIALRAFKLMQLESSN